MKFYKQTISLTILCILIMTVLSHVIIINTIQAEDQKKNSLNQNNPTPKNGLVQKGKPIIDARLIPLNESGTVLLDKNGKRIILQSTVVLREGLLEMLCCLKQTKEHESILSVDAEAYIIHAGLLVIGAKQGSPVSYTPKYQPAKGQQIDIFLQWYDQDKKLHRVNAKQWVKNAVNRYYAKKFTKKPVGLKIPRNSKLSYEEGVNELVWYGPMTDKEQNALLTYSQDAGYQKAIKKFHSESQTKLMEADWLFAGSYFVKSEEAGQPDTYAAQSGDLICVANFPSSMIDMGINSTASGEQNLMFEANMEQIPPLGTKVSIELIPVFKK